MKGEIDNSQIAHLLLKLADSLQLLGENKFKIKAYRSAAKSINTYPRPITSLLSSGEGLEIIPGVGKGIAGAVEEIIRTGTLKQLSEADAKVPDYLKELSAYPNLDLTHVERVYKKLNISSIAELKNSLENGEVEKKLGSRMAFQLRQGLSDTVVILWADADELVSGVLKCFKSIKTKAVPAGAYRRGYEVVNEVVFVISEGDQDQILKLLRKQKIIQELKSASETQALGRFSNGIPTRLRFTDADNFAVALFEETGSPAHFSELGKKYDLIADKPYPDEEALYQAMRLPYIEPELREGTGEVAAAQKDRIGQLVDIKDIRGDLHAHTTGSDGAHTIRQMVEAAIERGYEYLSISDHSQSLKIANGLSEERLLEQLDSIDRLQEHYPDFKIIKSAEVDILEDGSLDYSDAVLKKLDIRVCSIHSRFRLNRQKQTERLLRAMDNRYFNILGHATGRLILARDPYEIDIDKVLDAARERGCYLEINSSPDRLDLSDIDARLAKEMGLKVAVNTDAHSIRELDFMRFGLNQARRAWLNKDDVLNTYPWPDLRRLLKR